MPTVDDVLAAARHELGYLERPAGSNRTKFAAEAGHANGQPWCATFLVAIARRSGLSLPSTSPYTPTMAAGFRTAGRWHTDAQPGDFAFFDFPDNVHRIQHVGVVESVRADGSLTTIEGNTAPGTTGSQSNGGGVWRRQRARGLVVGYGRPIYAAAPAPTVTFGPSVEIAMHLQPVTVTITTDAEGRGNEPVPVPIDRIVSYLPQGIRPNVDRRYLTPDVAFAEEDGHTVVSVEEWQPNATVIVRLRIEAA